MSFKTLTSLTLIAFFWVAEANAQVSNGGFESSSALPNTTGQWSLVDSWSNAGSLDASPDYYHHQGTLGGDLPETPLAIVEAKAGNGIMGFVATGVKGSNYREYIVNELSTPLIPGEKYQLSFFITNGERTAASAAGLACSDLGVSFSTSAPQQNGTAPLNLTPDFVKQNVVYDRNWTSISFAFIANEAYTHFTFGVFGDDSDKSIQSMEGSSPSLAYYFVDEFEITELDDGFVSDSDPKNDPKQEETEEFTEVIDFFIPNAFTPNGDGDNDVFLPISSVIDEFTLKIFNKWGQLIYETTDVKSGWDGHCMAGKYANVDTYVWEITYLDPDGKQEDQVNTFTGTVNLIK